MTFELTRRHFVTGFSAAFAAASFSSFKAFANPLGLPLGLQLYSVRQQMAEDLDGTLAAVKAAGYTQVEAAALPKAKSSAEVRAALDKAGLRCVSAHHPFADLHTRFEEIVAYDQALGVHFLICSSPGYRTPPAAGGRPNPTLDDWHYNAEQFNIMGAQVASAGLQFGYHNHVGEFAVIDGKTPYLELLQLTDPTKVTFELDCGWATEAGADPIRIMREHPNRISMLHVKDFKATNAPVTDPHDAKVTELGLGTIDYKPIFAQAAKTQHIQHAFVEQESFDMPWQQSLKVDADYMRNLKG